MDFPLKTILGVFLYLGVFVCTVSAVTTVFIEGKTLTMIIQGFK